MCGDTRQGRRKGASFDKKGVVPIKCSSAAIHERQISLVKAMVPIFGLNLFYDLYPGHVTLIKLM